MTIKERLLTNITGAKALAVGAWLVVVQIPTTAAYLAGCEGITADIFKYVCGITVLLLGAFMGTRLAGDLGAMKSGNGNGK